MYSRIITPIQGLIFRLNNTSQQTLKFRRYRQYFIAGKHPDQIDEKHQEEYTKYLEHIIINSGLFDEGYYLANNKDVKRAGVNPLRHYVQYGGKEGREPSKAFDSSFYIYKYPEVSRIGANPLLHYIARSTKNAAILQSEDYSHAAKLKHVEAFDKELLKKSNSYDSVIVMDSMPWDDFLQQRPHHLARLLSNNGHLVIYIGDNTLALPSKLATNLYLVHDPKYIELFKKTKIPYKYFWLFSTMPIKLPGLRRTLSEGYQLIYDYIDDFHETISGDISNQLQVFSSLELLKPKILIASAHKLRAQLQKKFPTEEIILCPNAVDLNHFNYQQISKDPKRPDDLKTIISDGKPIIGYYGAIAPWLDYKLINKLTLKRKDLNFVFIGLNYNKGLSNLILRDNVYFLGPKNYHTLPQYSYWFDAAIIPFKKGDIAKATSPVKLFEYMAMGLPTVCTSDLNECKGYEYVYVSASVSDFEKNINEALKARGQIDVKNRLIQQASLNTWQVRAKAISDKINHQALKNEVV